jgi:hypothetical protein
MAARARRSNVPRIRADKGVRLIILFLKPLTAARILAQSFVKTSRHFGRFPGQAGVIRQNHKAKFILKNRFSAIKFESKSLKISQ